MEIVKNTISVLALYWFQRFFEIIVNLRLFLFYVSSRLHTSPDAALSFTNVYFLLAQPSTRTPGLVLARSLAQERAADELMARQGEAPTTGRCLARAPPGSRSGSRRGSCSHASRPSLATVPPQPRRHLRSFPPGGSLGAPGTRVVRSGQLTDGAALAPLAAGETSAWLAGRNEHFLFAVFPSIS